VRRVQKCSHLDGWTFTIERCSPSLSACCSSSQTVRRGIHRVAQV